MTRSLALPLLALALLASGCGGSSNSEAQVTTTTDSTTGEESTVSEAPSEDLGDFYSRRIDYEFKGQYGRSWDELHPGQQALVSRTKYEECREKTSDAIAGVDFKDLEVVETYEDPIDVTGVPERTSTAVTVRITASDATGERTVTDTFHAVAVDGEWKWVLPPADVRTYKEGNCPT